MNTMVPGGTAGTSDELEALVQKLAGNEAFMRCRERYNWSVHSLVDDMLRKSASPTEFLERFDAHFGSVRVMGNLLAQLRRDEKTLAYTELDKALQTDHFILTNEVVGIEQTLPVTVLMFEPAKTVVLLRWMAEAKTGELNRFIGVACDDRYGACPIQEITKTLFATFPTLEKYARENASLGRDNGSELALAYKDEIAGLPVSFDEAASLGHTYMLRLLDSADRGGSGSTFVFPIGFIFPNKEQSDVLGMLDRNEQARVSTWQMHVPKHVLRSHNMSKYMNIGMHPESEHAIWKKKLPAFTSKGVSQGYGMAFLTYSISNETIKDYRLGVSYLMHPDYRSIDGGKDSRILLRAQFESEAQYDDFNAALRETL